MRKLITAVILALYATTVYAACRNHTYTVDGKTTFCTTCCYGGNCTTTCF